MDITKVMSEESRLSEMRESLVKSLRGKIAAAPLEGTEILSVSPMVTIVSSKTLFSSPGKNLSAEYYITEEQAKAVEKRLSGCDSTRTLIERVRKMVSAKGVTVNASASYKGYVIQLNENTLAILAKFLDDAVGGEAGE